MLAAIVSSGLDTFRNPHWGGVIPLGSRYYIARRSDRDFFRALDASHATIVIKGHWHSGKSSMLIRTKAWADERKADFAFVDLGLFDSASFEAPSNFLKALAAALIRRLDLPVELESIFNNHRGHLVNFERFLRHQVLDRQERPLIWILDEADRLAASTIRREVFSLVESWNNERWLDPAGPMRLLIVVFAFSTPERDPFVPEDEEAFGISASRIILNDFSEAEVGSLNESYGGLVKGADELRELTMLVGGQPFLVHEALERMAQRGLNVAKLKLEALRLDGPFAEQLAALASRLERSPSLRNAVEQVLYGAPIADYSAFFCLRATSVLTGASPSDCRLYGIYESFLQVNPRLLRGN